LTFAVKCAIIITRYKKLYWLFGAYGMVDFNSNIKLVRYVYNKKFEKYHWLKDDLLQDGAIALLKAVETCKDEKTFIKYAITLIKREMYYTIRRERRHVGNLSIEAFDNDDICLEDNKSIDNSKICIAKTIYSKVIKDNKFLVHKPIIDKWIGGESCVEISSDIGCSRQNIDKIINKFRNSCVQIRQQQYDIEKG
jgi:RNA polymerase sigma factor (sigma-70 family)